MNEIVHLIGCGSVGFLVSQLIPTIETVKELYIYDGGYLDYWDWKRGIYPRNFSEATFKKVQAAKLEIMKRHPKFKVHEIGSNVTDTSKMFGLKIDCTDTKHESKLDVDFRVSCDDEIIVLDSREKMISTVDADYLHRGTSASFGLVAKEVIKYIEEKGYENKELKMGKVVASKGVIEYGNLHSGSEEVYTLFGEKVFSFNLS